MLLLLMLIWLEGLEVGVGVVEGEGWRWGLFSVVGIGV